MESFVKNILDVSITASYLAAAVVVLRLLLKKAPRFWTVLLWGLVALRLIIPSLPESNLSLIPDTAPITGSFTEQENTYVPPTVPTPPAEDAVGNENETVTTPPVSTPDKPIQTEKAQGPWTIVFWVWGAGACLMLCYAFISWFKIYRTVKGAAHTEGRIYSSGNTATPFILGVIRPKIYLPEGLSEKEKEYVITHERAHLKRGDHLWKPLGFLLLSIHWFNPLLWVAYVLLCRDIEIAADEKAIVALGEEHKKPYSHALISCSANRALIAACPLAFGEVGVKDRVKRVLNYKRPAFWIIIVSVIALIATSVFFLTDPKDNKSELVGTWYGSNVFSVGHTFRFDKNGKGISIGAEGTENEFKWETEDGLLKFKDPSPSIRDYLYDLYNSVFDSNYIDDSGIPYAIEDGELVFKAPDGERNEIRFSKTKETYGGDSALVTETPWVNENDSVSLTFDKYGVVRGTLKINQLYNLYRAHDGKLEIYLEGETLEYSYAVNNGILILVANKESIFLNNGKTPSDFENHPLLGTWYGIDVKNAGKEYVFKANGTGTWDFRFKYASFTWKDADGTLSFVEADEDYTPHEHKHTPGPFFYEKEYEIKDGVLTIDGLRYSNTKPDFGGDEELIYRYGFAEESFSRKRYFFHEGGSLEIWTYHTPVSTENDYNEVSYLSEDRIWIANKDTRKLTIISSHGEEVFTYSIFEDTLHLNNLTLVKYESLFIEETPDTSEEFITTDPDTGELVTPNPNYNGNKTTWELKSETLTVSGTGAMDYPPDSAVGFRNAKALVISEGITSIPTRAFDGYFALESISLPKSLYDIGSRAFEGCSALKEIILPPNVKNLEASVFDSCISLKKVVLPKKLNNVSSSAFNNCPNLEKLILEEGNERYFVKDDVLYSKSKTPYTNSYAYHLEFCPRGKQGACTVDTNVSFTNPHAFEYCAKLTSVVFTEKVNAHIRENMFYGCTSLKEIRIMNKNVAHIEQNAFAGCPNLEALVYGGTTKDWAAQSKHVYWFGEDEPTVKKITCTDGTVEVKPFVKFWSLDEDGTFTLLADGGYSNPPLWENDKEKIKTVIIKDGVAAIPQSAFSGCINLTKVVIPDSVTVVNTSAFFGCSSLTEISLPDGINMSENWFNGCTALKKVKLPKNLEVLGYSTFEGCMSLTSVTLPESLKTISPSAFEGCTALIAIHIPDSVTEIGWDAFLYCRSLRVVTGGAGVKTVRSSAFAETAIADIGFLKNVTYMDKMMFAHCVNLENVVIPKGIGGLSQYMFFGAGVKTLHLHANVQVIDSYAFADSKKLEAIYYDGTVEEWNKVQLCSKWLGDDLSGTVKVICKDGTVTAANKDGPIDYGP